MTSDFKYFSFRRNGQQLTVVWSSYPLGAGLVNEIDVEFANLLTLDFDSLILDMRQIKLVDGCFARRIIKLCKALEESGSIRLAVCLSGPIKEVFSLVGMSKILDIVEIEDV